MSLTSLEFRILQISHDRGLSHLGSNLTCVGLIDQIYREKGKDDLFLLGEGHAGLALYVVLEKFYEISPQIMLDKYGIHATRMSYRVDHQTLFEIPMSSGSLGQVESTAPGFAMMNPDRKVYLLSSDGGMQEGVCWSALRLKRNHELNNLIWRVNANGYGALDEIDFWSLTEAIHAICDDVRVLYTEVDKFPFLHGVDAHYYKMTESDWQWVQEQEIVDTP